MRALSLTPKAESDLIDIWVYTCEEWGADQADGYLDQLEAGMMPLIQPPCSGPTTPMFFPGIADCRSSITRWSIEWWRRRC